MSVVWQPMPTNYTQPVFFPIGSPTRHANSPACLRICEIVMQYMGRQYHEYEIAYQLTDIKVDNPRVTSDFNERSVLGPNYRGVVG